MSNERVLIDEGQYVRRIAISERSVVTTAWGQVRHCCNPSLQECLVCFLNSFTSSDNRAIKSLQYRRVIAHEYTSNT